MQYRWRSEGHICIIFIIHSAGLNAHLYRKVSVHINSSPSFQVHWRMNGNETHQHVDVVIFLSLIINAWRHQQWDQSDLASYLICRSSITLASVCQNKKGDYDYKESIVCLLIKEIIKVDFDEF